MQKTSLKQKIPFRWEDSLYRSLCYSQKLPHLSILMARRKNINSFKWSQLIMLFHSRKEIKFPIAHATKWDFDFLNHPPKITILKIVRRQNATYLSHILFSSNNLFSIVFCNYLLRATLFLEETHLKKVVGERLVRAICVIKCSRSAFFNITPQVISSSIWLAN